MSSPDRTPEFTRFLFVVFAIGMVSPTLEFTLGAITSSISLDEPWATLVRIGAPFTSGVLGAFAVIWLDDRRRRRDDLRHRRM